MRRYCEHCGQAIECRDDTLSSTLAWTLIVLIVLMAGTMILAAILGK